MKRWLLPFLPLAILAIAAYPRLRKRLLCYQSHRAAEAAPAQIATQLSDGDLIFHTSLSAQSRAIQLATHSPWSHCGIVYKEAGNWQVFEAGQPLLGHNYDLYFGWSDERIYCSELIWKVYERGLDRRLGQLQHLRDFDLSQPAVQVKLRERYGDKLPLNETVISPVSIFNSPELVTVLSR